MHRTHRLMSALSTSSRSSSTRTKMPAPYLHTTSVTKSVGCEDGTEGEYLMPTWGVDLGPVEAFRLWWLAVCHRQYSLDRQAGGERRDPVRDPDQPLLSAAHAALLLLLLLTLLLLLLLLLLLFGVPCFLPSSALASFTSCSHSSTRGRCQRSGR